MATDRIDALVQESGGSDFAVRIVVSGHVIDGDEPEAAGGRNLGPSPYDLLLAALGECTAMTIRLYARQKGWPLDEVEVGLTHRKGDVEGRPAWTDHFTKVIRLHGPALSDEQRVKLVEIAAKCPIQRTLQGDPVIETRLATS
jgi:putative redox protein